VSSKGADKISAKTKGKPRKGRAKAGFLLRQQGHHTNTEYPAQVSRGKKSTTNARVSSKDSPMPTTAPAPSKGILLLFDILYGPSMELHPLSARRNEGYAHPCHRNRW